MLTIMDHIATTHVKLMLAVYFFVSIIACEVGGTRSACGLFMCLPSGCCLLVTFLVFLSLAEERMCLPTAREAHREWFECCSSSVCVYFRAGHSREVIVRTNEETNYHSDPFQRVMCAKSSL